MQNFFKKQAQHVVLLFVIATLGVTSCKKAPEEAKMIPSDANMVVMVNMGEIKSKNTDYTKILDYLSGDLTEDQEKLMESGINLDGYGYAFGKMTEEKGGYMAGIIPLDDKDKFKSYLKDEFKDLEETDDEILKLTKYTAVKLSEGQAIVASHEEFRSSGDVVEKLQTILATKESESLPKSNDNFKKAASDIKDILVWVNTGALYEEFPDDMKEDMVPMTNTFMAMDISFDKGKMTSDIVFTGNDELGEINKATATGGANSDVLDQLNGAEPIGALSISTKLDAVVTYMEENDYDQALAGMLRGMGFEIEELATFLTGDISLVINDLQQEGFGMPQADFTASLGLKDREKFEEFLSSQGLAVQDGEIDMMGVHAKIEDKYVRISGMKSEYVDKVKNEETEDLSSSIREMMLENEMSLFIDITKIPESYKSLAGGKEGPVGEFEAVKFTANVKGNDVHMNFTIDFTDKEENSLMILSRLGEKADKMM